MENIFGSIFIFFAYIFGGIPTAYIIAKRIANLNILHVGSGNSGASNLMFQTNFFVGISAGASVQEFTELE